MNPTLSAYIRKIDSDKGKLIDVNLFPVWRRFKMPKYYKEFIKFILYSSLPFIFRKFLSYHRWKASHIFSGPQVSLWKNILLSHFFSSHHPITLKLNTKSNPQVPIERVAVVIHSFYPEILQEIISAIHNSDLRQPKLFVTTPADMKTENQVLLQNAGIPFELTEVENRGRDMLPFLICLPAVLSQNFKLLLKLHTKKSNYLGENNGWRESILQELLHPLKIASIFRAFEVWPQLGILGPHNQCLPMSLFYGANAERVKQLSLTLGLETSQLLGLYFVGGSMFYVRPEALQPIIQLGLTDEDFEEEAGQLDGTLAHALERVVSAALIKNGYLIGDTGSTPDEIKYSLKLSHEYSI